MTGNVVLDGRLLIQCTARTYQQSAMVAIHSAAFYLFRKVGRIPESIGFHKGYVHSERDGTYFYTTAILGIKSLS